VDGNDALHRKAVRERVMRGVVECDARPVCLARQRNELTDGVFAGMVHNRFTSVRPPYLLNVPGGGKVRERVRVLPVKARGKVPDVRPDPEIVVLPRVNADVHRPASR